MHRAIHSVAAIGLLGITVGVATPAAAQAAPCANGRAEGVQAVTALPWAQRWLDLEHAWPLASEGAGVRVAVLDTGVDRRHPQLASAVLPGRDFVDGTDGRVDCTGHGTGVAALIAARRDAAVGFAGVAPQAQILPVRVTDRIQADINPVTVGAGVDWAVANGARVIVIAFSVGQESASLQAAVARAVAQDVVVIAAAGEGDAGRFPAAYDGVIGANAIDSAGAVSDQARTGSIVDLAAPGAKMTTAAPARGHTVYDGGSDLAAAVVGGVAALVRAQRPDLSGAQVATRLGATADPAMGSGSAYGQGIVNAVRALSEPLTEAAPGPVERMPSPQPKPRRVTGVGPIVAATCVAATVLVMVGMGLRRLRRRMAWGERRQV
ncbi:MAG: S8 family serine peptidase [Hamadaea sp.]|uniref:S8 family serine peptidase n=1 Tax=Hamadaea sp. TaxID=2024425 RepID=UPI0017D8A0A3|nr:S8 family serine peptidase [Hamadaea sp.]NUT20412.1 S8 family serine peptidase [Hamadaea sp.]